MDKHVAKELLKDMHEVLSNLGMRHFIIDGTLLGAVRDNGFINHDNDIDFGVFAEDWTEELLEKLRYELRKKKIKEHHTFGELDLYYEMSFMRDGIKCDIFFYRAEDTERGRMRIFHAFLNGGVQLPQDVITYEYQANLIEEIGQLNFLGGAYPAPLDAVAVLEAKYGRDWRVPVEKWDWAFDPKNVRTTK